MMIVYNVIYVSNDCEGLYSTVKTFDTLEKAREYFNDCIKSELDPNTHFGHILEKDYNGDAEKMNASDYVNRKNDIYTLSDNDIFVQIKFWATSVR